MITITHRPEALAIREQVGPTGEPEVVVFGVDQAAGIVVEIAMDPESAVAFGESLCKPRIDVAGADMLEQLKRTNGRPQ
jgi:hypothetical protein